MSPIRMTSPPRMITVLWILAAIAGVAIIALAVLGFVATSQTADIKQSETTTMDPTAITLYAENPSTIRVSEPAPICICNIRGRDLFDPALGGYFRQRAARWTSRRKILVDGTSMIGAYAG